MISRCLIKNLRLAGAMAVATFAAGCSALDYYAQSIEGHFAMLRAARPIPEIVSDPSTAESLKQRLQRAERIRAFASSELALPENQSYRSYADLQRPFVVWNVFATPELSLELKQWCYPVVGCAGYRGYFERTMAEEAAEQLRAEGYEVNVTGVPAYSTLGWFADPLLNTFIGGTEGQLAGLIFHELAHQVVFVGGDTTFNESFATAVEREGVRRWLAANGDDASRMAYAEFAQRRHEFLNLLLQYRGLLFENYQGPQPTTKARTQAAAFRGAERRLRAAECELGWLRRLRPVLCAGPDQRAPGVDRRLQRPGAGVRRAAGASRWRLSALL